MDVNLADQCAEIARALPGRCALVCDGERLSYPELMARSNQVAQHPIASGIKPDETVGLQAMYPDLYITNRFGASETGTDGQLDRGEDGQPRLAHAGNVQVLDEQLRPVPPGGTGRIAKSGHVPLSLAGYQVPSRIEFVPLVVRSPAGKADYRRASDVLAAGPPPDRPAERFTAT
jgi:non-ribosomal peptide synthetase component E (peptide arylation enzyme)